ncbi:hypothetical protein RHMOL_Rhmol09G0104500 [Rhododendron molle]|uniref:Uncharacterized protein n=1 Tax=Rhododendron molle TaxID=49168 RepID=A0ACC0MDK4_RHOML|nr:hypothetical protein RHMOL_Rhmol09G0104500 [Rhododendron molle]
MAETGGGSGNGRGGGDDQLRVEENKVERPPIDDQPLTGASSSVGAAVSGVDRGGDGHAEEVGGDGERRTPVDLVRVPVELGPVGPWVS